MTATTETLTRPSEPANPKAPTPPKVEPPSRTRLGLAWIGLILAGIAVAVLAVITFTGGDDGTDVQPIPFDPQVEQWEREAHLENNARTHLEGADTATTDNGEFLPGSRHVPTS